MPRDQGAGLAYSRLRDEVLRVLGPRAGHELLKNVSIDRTGHGSVVLQPGGGMSDAIDLVRKLEGMPDYVEGGAQLADPSVSVDKGSGSLTATPRVEALSESLGDDEIGEDLDPMLSDAEDVDLGDNGSEDLSKYDELYDEYLDNESEVATRPERISRGLSKRLDKLKQLYKPDLAQLNEKLMRNLLTVENTGSPILGGEGILKASELSPHIQGVLSQSMNPLGIRVSDFTPQELEILKTYSPRKHKRG